MHNFAYSGKKPQRTCKSVSVTVKCIFRYLLLRANPFWVQLCYFLSFSFLGFVVLKALKTRTSGSYDPGNLDLFFTSVSATTVSSMSTVEMEVFSNTQLLVLTILMFTGGEVFTSMVGLHFHKLKTKKLWKSEEKVSSVMSDTLSVDELESGVTSHPRPQNQVQIKSENNQDQYSPAYLKYRSIKCLCYVVLGYLVLIHVTGVTLISLYFVLISSAKQVLDTKGLELITFSVFTTVSTFASCGFVPTNENMIVFKKNSGLLLILVPQVLLGNTLFPSCLRLCVWVFWKLTKRTEWEYLMKNTGRVGYMHLLGGVHSRMLAVTVTGFVVVQMVLFSAMDWNSDALSGLSGYEKVVGVMFQSVNARHAGETVVDITVISKAVLVLFVIMMYLPPYTSIMPVKDDGEEEMHPQIREKSSRKRKVVENLIFSQLSYLAIFVILICITERQKLKQDPLNFNVLNIVVEVISAYGNVGFTTGYSCARQLNPNKKCIDKWYGFSGKWSDGGKVVLILVMFFGRLKKFNTSGGRAWILM